MNARLLLSRVARILEESGLEAVLIGNAAAADFKFMFRKTPANLRRLKTLAAALDAVLFRSYYPRSDLFRIMRDDDGLRLDFVATVRPLSGMKLVDAQP